MEAGERAKSREARDEVTLGTGVSLICRNSDYARLMGSALGSHTHSELTFSIMPAVSQSSLLFSSHTSLRLLTKCPKRSPPAYIAVEWGSKMTRK
jgi:hypothetical protein